MRQPAPRRGIWAAGHRSATHRCMAPLDPPTPHMYKHLHRHRKGAARAPARDANRSACRDQLGPAPATPRSDRHAVPPGRRRVWLELQAQADQPRRQPAGADAAAAGGELACGPGCSRPWVGGTCHIMCACALHPDRHGCVHACVLQPGRRRPHAAPLAGGCPLCPPRRRCLTSRAPSACSVSRAWRR